MSRFDRPTTKALQLFGRAALLSGSYDQAIAKQRLALLIEPDDPELKMELGISFALRASAEQRALDYEFALEQMLQSVRITPRSEFLFSTAYLLNEFPVPFEASEMWKKSIAKENDQNWRSEAEERLQSLQTRMAKREQELRSASDLLSHFENNGHYEAGFLEVAMSETLEHLLTLVDQSTAAYETVTRLATIMRNENKDFWLIDLMKAPKSDQRTAAFQQLSMSWVLNLDGDHIRAGLAAKKAERLFEQLGNQAGVMRARIELAYSLDRRWLEHDCMDAIRGVRTVAAARHYPWIEGQAWLEEIACTTETRHTDVIDPRVRAFEWITKTRFEGLRLRSLSFLTESYGGLDSRIQVWSQGREGLAAYWNSILPANRGYTFYYTLATSARAAGDRLAALALLREGVHALQGFRYRQLVALALSDLGAWESEDGNADAAKTTFSQMLDLFNRLERNESNKFWREGQITMAESDVRSGRPLAALSRLQELVEGMRFPYPDFGPTERRRLLPVFGSAYLKTGRLDEAARFYQQIITESLNDLSSVTTYQQRDNAFREVEAAWRGMTQTYLSEGKDEEAFWTWKSFRGRRLGLTKNSQIQPGATVTSLAFAFLPDGLAGWVASGNHVEHKMLNAELVKREAVRLSELVADPNSPPDALDSSAQRLYSALIQPFANQIVPGTYLVIDPDGPLAAVPWLALQDGEGHALIERVAISQVFGLPERVLEPEQIDLQRALIFGMPTLVPMLASAYRPLLEASREAKMLHRELPHSVFFEGLNATPANLISNLPAATVFHFAGHGVSFGGFGALVLSSSAANPTEPRLFTARQISAMRLPRLQLAVLAACSSGIGEQSGDVNLDSLVRGFLEAGTHQVIASRSTVDSAETAELMDLFYAGLQKGLSPAEALRQAALSVRQKASHPYYWAGFQVFGRP